MGGGERGRLSVVDHRVSIMDFLLDWLVLSVSLFCHTHNLMVYHRADHCVICERATITQANAT